MSRKGKQETGSKKGVLLGRLDSAHFTGREIFAMLLPLILDQFFIHGIALLATAMVSSSGMASMSAVGLVNPVNTMIYSFFNALPAGGCVLLSRLYGQKKEREMGVCAGSLMTSMAVLALLLFILMAVFSGKLTAALFSGAESDVLDMASLYLTGLTFSLIPHAVYLTAFTVFRSVGKTRLCMVLSVVINGTYFLYSILFLNILHLGVKGAALSYICARLTGAAVSAAALIIDKRVPRIPLRAILCPGLSSLGSVLSVGLPFTVEQLCFNGGGILMSVFLVRLGTGIVAANAVTESVSTLFFSMGTAVAYLAVTVIGQCAGAGDRAAAERYGKQLTILGVLSVLLSILLFGPFLPQLLVLFHAPAEQTALILRLLRISLVFMAAGWSGANILPNVLRAGGDVAFASYSSLGTMWIIRVGLGYVLAFPAGLGVRGVWIALGCEYLIRFLIYALRFRSGKWYHVSGK